jgi:hypothetical protein
MQYTQRKLQRSVTEIRRSRSGRPSVSVAVITIFSRTPAPAAQAAETRLAARPRPMPSWRRRRGERRSRCDTEPVHGSAGSKESQAACEPLKAVRRLYDAWNAVDVAGAAEVLSPAVRWEPFGTSSRGRATGPAGQGGASGGTWMLSPVAVDLLVCVVDHVIAFSRRSGPHGEAEAERLEVWTLRDGQAVHYRGYGLDEGLVVLSETTGSPRIEAICRGVPAFNRATWTAGCGCSTRGRSSAQPRSRAYLASPATSRTDGSRPTAHATVQLPTGGGEHAADPAL